MSIKHIVTVERLASALGSLFADMRDLDGEFPLDVRLQVIPESEQWELHFGDSSYDTDHHGVWADGVWADGELDGETLLQDLASDLIEQIEDALSDY